MKQAKTCRYKYVLCTSKYRCFDIVLNVPMFFISRPTTCDLVCTINITKGSLGWKICTETLYCFSVKLLTVFKVKLHCNNTTLLFYCFSFKYFHIFFGRFSALWKNCYKTLDKCLVTVIWDWMSQKVKVLLVHIWKTGIGFLSYGNEGQGYSTHFKPVAALTVS